MTALSGGYLFAPHSIGIGGPAPDLAALLERRPTCHLLFNMEKPPPGFFENDVASDLTWVLPEGPGPHPIPPEHLSALVAVLDADGIVAVCGTDPETVAVAIDTVLTMTGGGHA